MENRVVLSRELDSRIFREYYYLKQELIEFCRENGLPASGSKEELTERIAHFLDTGEVQKAKTKSRRAAKVEAIDLNSAIEDDFVCSQKHRAFFKAHIGGSFSFNVTFQKWLRSNAGKTYGQAVEAYYQIQKDKKKNKTTIDKQFEYNAYIRDFFADNKGKSLEDAIQCWKYKKRLQGHNRYEESDLAALER